MGSKGSGRIRDYPGSSKGRGRTGGGDKGQPPEDRCARAFAVDLEDIEHSSYYVAHRAVPPVGTALRLVHTKRVVAQTASGETIGSLPTSYNYLASCLKDGWTYSGTVRSSSSGPPVAKISADFAANAP